MPANRRMLYFNDGTTYQTSKQYGPLNLGSVGKLFRVAFRGAVFSPLVELGSASALLNGSVFGLQQGPAGFTPNPAIAGGDAANWLALGGLTFGPQVVVWAPTTANGYGLAGNPVEMTWTGQLYVGENTDVYFTMGAIADPGSSLAVSGSIEVLCQ